MFYLSSLLSTIWLLHILLYEENFIHTSEQIHSFLVLNLCDWKSVWLGQFCVNWVVTDLCNHRSYLVDDPFLSEKKSGLGVIYSLNHFKICYVFHLLFIYVIVYIVCLLLPSLFRKENFLKLIFHCDPIINLTFFCCSLFLFNKIKIYLFIYIYIY